MRDASQKKLALIASIGETMEELRTITHFENARWFPNKWLLATVRRVDEMLDDILNDVAEL
ncbi:MAG: hypothetical protein ACXU9C_01655 [Xanthobacteraceae bacterium]